MTRSTFPQGKPYARWRELAAVELDDLTAFCYGTLAGDEQAQEDYFADEHRLSKSFSLVAHLPQTSPHRDEVAFYQMMRKQLRKLEPTARRNIEDLERAMRDLVDESVSAQPAVDIFAVSGLERPDISILDEEFPAGFKQLEKQRRKRELGLSDEELAFCDVIKEGAPIGLPTENEWIADLVKAVVQAVRSNVKVDWTRSHRSDVYAGVKSAV